MKGIFTLNVSKVTKPPEPPNTTVPVHQPSSPPPSASSLGIVIDDNDDVDIDHIDEPLVTSDSKRISIKDKIKGIIKKVSFTKSSKPSSPTVTSTSAVPVQPVIPPVNTVDNNQDQYEYYDLPPVDNDDTDVFYGQQSSSSSAVVNMAAANAITVTSSVSSRRNKFVEFLKTHPYEEIKKQVSEAPKTSSSVKIHDHFFQERYITFCNEAGVPTLPFSREVMDTFFWSMSQVYRWSSIENHAVPALKRYHLQQTGQYVTEDVGKMLADSKVLARNNATNMGNDMASDPVLYDDLLRIIKTFPIHYPRMAYDVSAYLFAFNTGARVSSVVNIELRDIYQVMKESDESYYCKITLRKLKNESQPFNVTLKGHIYQDQYESDDSLMDFFNWFRIHLQTTFNLDILTFNDWDLTSELANTKIWPDKEDAMSKRFKERAIKAGYDGVRFTFHSLRAGFLSQIMINNRNNPEAFASAMDNAAAVARWNPRGKAMLKYKRRVDESIVSSNLTDPNPRSSAVIPDSLVTSEGFHGITIGSPKWHSLANFKGFRAAITKKIKEQFTNLDDDELQRLAKLSIERALYAFGKDDEDIVAEFLQSDETYIGHFFTKRARHKITQLITDNPSGFDDLVAHFYDVYICALPAYGKGDTSTTGFIVDDNDMDVEGDDQVEYDEEDEDEFNFDQPDTDDDNDNEYQDDAHYGDMMAGETDDEFE